MEVPHVENELALREVQLSSLKILERVDAICNKENIRYWAMYGTLIGAVRHHGFIPWDDDLDIAMPRPDYERFLSWCRQHSKEIQPLVAIDGYRMKLPFLITRMSDTTYKMIGEFGDEVPELGTFIDIYPIDGCGDTIDLAQKHKNQCMIESKRYLQAGNFAYNNRNAGTVKRVLKSFHAVILGDKDKQAEKIHKLATQIPFESSEYVACLEWDWAISKIYPRTALQDIKRVPFENFSIPIPIGYNQVLENDYGNYMQLPPENERVGHHFYSIVRR